MKKLLFSAFLLYSFTSAYCQLKPEEAIQRLYSTYPQEKVVLNLSKSDYVAGETIFFKAYVLTGYEPSDISTNLYAELLDRNKKTISHQVFPIYKGSADGALQIPASQGEDVYYLRTYTRWMLNFPEQFNNLVTVKIYNPYSGNKIALKAVDWTAEIFPESGAIINDVSCQVGIRLKSQGSLPKSWKGQLLEDGKPLEEVVNAYNSQVGSFQYTPIEGHSYSLKITDNNGTFKEVQIPQPRPTGVLLQLRPIGDRLAYRMYFHNIDSSGKGYKLVATINDQNVFAAVVRKSAGMVEGSISTKELPAGVINFTLFDVNNKPVASRLYFLDPQLTKIHKPTINNEGISFAPRALNKLGIEEDSLSWYTYSVQVQDASYPQPPNFLAGLYLSSDFPGDIQDADWYFDFTNRGRAEALDALMITESWKRFNWNELLANRFPPLLYKPDKYLAFQATVMKGKKPQSMKQINMIVKTKDSTSSFLQVEADSSGHFYLDNAFFIDTMQVFYQLNSKKYSAKEISIDFKSLNEFHPLKQALPLVEYELQPRTKTDTIPFYIARATELRNEIRTIDEKYKMMEAVVIRTNTRSATQKLNEQLSSGLFQSMNEKVFDFINSNDNSAQGSNNILDWLQGRVPGYTVRYNETHDMVPMIRGSQASLFVDEMQVEPDFVSSLSTSEIAMVKVMRGPFAGARGGGEAISIYLKKGGMHSKNEVPSLPSNYLVGYMKMPAFFAPDYSNDVYKSFSDKREILARQQTIVPTEERSKAVVEFNNNDVTNSYRVIITGFTNSGIPVYLDKVIDKNN
jgi:hypothetical protein